MRTDLLPEAYVAPRELRDLRDLLRHRVVLTRMRTALQNRVHALLARPKNGQSIYCKKKRGEPYRTLSWQDAFNRVVYRRLWPTRTIADRAVRRNLDLLTAYRDNAVHFYNEPRFGVLVYALAQTSVLNYRDLLEAAFHVDLGTELNWHLLPLGVQPPLDPIEYLRGQTRGGDGGSTGQAARDFVRLLHEYTEELERDDVDTARLLTVFEVNLQSTKKIARADIVVGVERGDDNSTRIVSRPMDPNRTHPLLQKHVLERVGELDGQRFTSYSFQAVVQRYGLKENPRLCWIDEETQWARWSPEVVTFIRSLSAAEIQDVRTWYRDQQRRKRQQRA